MDKYGMGSLDQVVRPCRNYKATSMLTTSFAVDVASACGRVEDPNVPS